MTIQRPVLVLAALLLSVAVASAQTTAKPQTEPDASAPQFITCEQWKTIRDARTQFAEDPTLRTDAGAQKVVKMGDSFNDYIKGYVRGVVETTAALTKDFATLREFGWSTGVAEAMTVATCEMNPKASIVEASFLVAGKILKKSEKK